MAGKVAGTSTTQLTAAFPSRKKLVSRRAGPQGCVSTILAAAFLLLVLLAALLVRDSLSSESNTRSALLRFANRHLKGQAKKEGQLEEGSQTTVLIEGEGVKALASSNTSHNGVTTASNAVPSLPSISEAAASGRHAEGTAGAPAEAKTNPTSPAKHSHPAAGGKLVIEVEEDASCAVPRQVGPCTSVPAGEHIHVLLVSAMWQRENETKVESEVFLKSLLASTRCPLHLHFLVAGEPEASSLRAMAQQAGGQEAVPLPSPIIEGTAQPGSSSSSSGGSGYQGPLPSASQAPLLFSLHQLPAAWVEARLRAMHMWPPTHHAGLPGLSKFFLADIMWQVRRGVFLDIDMVAGSDIAQLHALQGEFDADPRLLYFMATNHPEGGTYKRYRKPYCSCQMVLDLQRIRERNLTKLLVDAVAPRKPRDLQEFVDDGDQWLYMWACKSNPGVCKVLPRLWNVSGCTKPLPFLGLTSHGREKGGSCWHMVHFNCVGHSKGKKSPAGKDEPYGIPEGWRDAYAWARNLEWSDLKTLSRI